MIISVVQNKGKEVRIRIREKQSLKNALMN